jgi:hypothetical protein
LSNIYRQTRLFTAIEDSLLQAYELFRIWTLGQLAGHSSSPISAPAPAPCALDRGRWSGKCKCRSTSRVAAGGSTASSIVLDWSWRLGAPPPVTCHTCPEPRDPKPRSNGPLAAARQAMPRRHCYSRSHKALGRVQHPPEESTPSWRTATGAGTPGGLPNLLPKAGDQCWQARYPNWYPTTNWFPLPNIHCPLIPAIPATGYLPVHPDRARRGQ